MPLNFEPLLVSRTPRPRRSHSAAVGVRGSTASGCAATNTNYRVCATGFNRSIPVKRKTQGTNSFKKRAPLHVAANPLRRTVFVRNMRPYVDCLKYFIARNYNQIIFFSS